MRSRTTSCYMHLPGAQLILLFCVTAPWATRALTHCTPCLCAGPAHGLSARGLRRSGRPPACARAGRAGPMGC